MATEDKGMVLLKEFQDQLQAHYEKIQKFVQDQGSLGPMILRAEAEDRPQAWADLESAAGALAGTIEEIIGTEGCCMAGGDLDYAHSGLVRLKYYANDRFRQATTALLSNPS